MLQFFFNEDFDKIVKKWMNFWTSLLTLTLTKPSGIMFSFPRTQDLERDERQGAYI